MNKADQDHLERMGYSFLNGVMVTSSVEYRSPSGAVEFCCEPAFALRVREKDGKWSPYVELPRKKILQMAATMIADATRNGLGPLE